jgi:hypothetical protein
MMRKILSDRALFTIGAALIAFYVLFEYDSGYMRSIVLTGVDLLLMVGVVCVAWSVFSVVASRPQSMRAPECPPDRSR